MGILEVPRLPQNPNEDEAQISLAAAELPLVEAKRLLTNEQLADLMARARAGGSDLHELARQGIFVWLTGQDNDILGVHAKKEKGRNYEAFLLATSEVGGSYIDMSFKDGDQAWVASVPPTAEPPDALVATLGDIAKINEETAQKARRARAANWYQNRTNHPAYTTNMGPNLPSGLKR